MVYDTWFEMIKEVNLLVSCMLFYVIEWSFEVLIVYHCILDGLCGYVRYRPSRDLTRPT